MSTIVINDVGLKTRCHVTMCTHQIIADLRNTCRHHLKHTKKSKIQIRGKRMGRHEAFN